MGPCSTSVVASYFNEELGVHCLHKVLANKEATGSKVGTTTYPLTWLWVVLVIAIRVTDWGFLALMPFCLESMTPSWQIAMPTTALKLLIQSLFKCQANLVKKDPNQEIHMGFVVVSKKIMLNTTPTVFKPISYDFMQCK